MLPLKGRGFEQVDIRIHKIDPLNRTFWPFPNEAVAVDESAVPPAPGEEPQPFEEESRFISASEPLGADQGPGFAQHLRPSSTCR